MKNLNNRKQESRSPLCSEPSVRQFSPGRSGDRLFLLGFFMQELTIANQSYPVVNLPGRPPAILDKDVAKIYEVETREVNQARIRNSEKFPLDFCYQLTVEELTEAVTSCDNLKFNPCLPHVYTWEGCNMLATILKSDIATKRVIQIIRGFTGVEKGQLSQQMIEVETGRLANSLLENRLKAAKLLGVPEHYGQIEAVKDVKRKCGVDFRPLLLVAPAQDNVVAPEEMLEPTEIGLRLGGISGQKINNVLRDLGLQTKVNTVWIATKKGEKLSASHAWVTKSKTGYNYKWNFSDLKEHLIAALDLKGVLRKITSKGSGS